MPYQNVAELFMLNTRRFPSKTALIAGGRRLSYAELNDEVNRLARGFLALGLRPGDKAAYLLRNCPELIEVYYALQKIGAAAVPLNHRLAAPEIGRLLRFSRCRLLVCGEEFQDKLPAADSLPELLLIHRRESGAAASGPLSLRAAAALGGGEEPALFRDAAAVSRLQFTGGTTGLPKGALRTHRADLAEIISVMMSSRMGADPGETVLVQCPLGHHGGHSWFASALSSGATLVIGDAFQPAEILTAIERERITYLLLLPPSTYLRLLDHPDFGRYDLSSVKLVQSSAGAAAPDVVRRIYQGFPHCEVNYGWGQTESGTGTSLVLRRAMLAERAPALSSVGLPMPFLEVMVADAAGRETPPGVVGEALVRGPALFSGYCGQPEADREVFLPDGWLRTGDMMKRDEDGYLYMVSRKTGMIKSGGENVFVQEVENALRLHPAVEECVVFGMPDAVFGEAVAAAVKVRAGAAVTAAEIRAHCRRHIADYKKPRLVRFVGEIAMDEAGKIRRCEIIKQLCKEEAAWISD
ncbi:MAG: acyl--CoA ligase [Gracilibacteraceae bacterium]|jgi:acyl-CoA synthetase (AMP-forming)/AMP-acid ligase II|nr:acyl--CoA ligase [Gracilibacteraceae bacterium]